MATAFPDSKPPSAIDGLELIGAGESFQDELFNLIASTAIFNHFELKPIKPTLLSKENLQRRDI